MAFGLLYQVPLWLVLGQGTPVEGLAGRAEVSAVERLIALAPADSAAILTVENLATQMDRGAEHPAYRAFTRLLEARGGLESRERKQLERGRAEIEAVLGLSVEELGREVFGEAVVLALKLAPETGEPAGLLILDAPDETKLRKAISALNDAESSGGALEDVGTRKQGDLSYQTRRFRDGRPSDFFAVLDDGLLVWSSSESMLKAVLERAEEEKSARLALPGWISALRGRLPADSTTSLYLNVPAILPLMTGESEPARGLVEGMEGVGVAARFGVTTVDLQAIERIKHGVGSTLSFHAPGAGHSMAARLSGPVYAVAAGSFDFDWLSELLLDLASEGDSDRRVLLETVVAGLLGGQSVFTASSSLGPGTLLAWMPTKPRVEGKGFAPDLIAAVELAPGIRDTIESFCRTVLAIAALDPKQRAAGASLGEIETNTGILLHFRRTGFELFVSVGEDLMVLGTNQKKVEAFVGTDRMSTPAFAGMQELAESADQFVWLDLKAIRGWMDGSREALLDRITADSGGDHEAAARELEQLTTVLKLFDVASLTNQIEEDHRLWRQRLRLELTPSAP